MNDSSAQRAPLWESHRTVDDFIEDLGEDIPWLHQYRYTPQDPEWHAEGDVHVHVDWVLAELRGLFEGEAAHLGEDDKTVLTLAALLHDVAKPVTTKPVEIAGKTRIAAPAHEAVGANHLFYKQAPCGITVDHWQQVIALTAAHHLPKSLVVRERPARDYHALARRASPELLYWLERADMQGRECRDKAEQLDILELFKCECEDNGVWGGDPYAEFRAEVESRLTSHTPFTRKRIFWQGVRAFESGDIVMLEESFARFYRFLENQAHLVILCGPSGSGKSSHAEAAYPTYTRISPDQIREQEFAGRLRKRDQGVVFHQARDALRESLRMPQSVIWDATNLRRDQRQRLVGIGLDYEAFVSLVVFQKPEPILSEHNRARGESAVSDDVLHSQLRRFQLPDITEAHDLELVAFEK